MIRPGALLKLKAKHSGIQFTLVENRTEERVPPRIYFLTPRDQPIMLVALKPQTWHADLFDHHGTRYYFLHENLIWIKDIEKGRSIEDYMEEVKSVQAV